MFESEILFNYASGNYTVKELMQRYSYSRWKILDVIRKGLTKHEIEFLRLKHVREKTLESKKRGLNVGVNHWNWQGGITENRDRYSPEYKKWHSAVLGRDNYTCQLCSLRGTPLLCAHHIKSWKNYPEYRYDVNNGITLCEDCHISVETNKWAGG
jgi:predicted restriction endonuclease